MEFQGDKTVLIAGSSGFTGKRLRKFLEKDGYCVRGLGRESRKQTDFVWDLESGEMDPRAMEGVGAVINLAGENIAGGRWTTSMRQRILESRIKGTRLLVDSMKKSTKPPSVFLSASGANFYGSSSREVDESSSRGEGFLAEVCEQWEAEAMRASEAGIRTVCLRTGVVLHPDGGALARMLPIFRMGLGGRIGSGKQGFPWIAMEDLLRSYAFCMENTVISGPVNAVHPIGLSQADFARDLAQSLSRKMGPPLPKFMVKLIFGRMGEETLLADLRIYPRQLLSEGFRFRSSKLPEALSSMLEQPNS